MTDRDRETEVAALITFAVAEQVMFGDSLTSLINAAEALRTSIDQKDGLGAMKAWNQMGDDMTYIGTLLNLKGSMAAKQWVESRGQGDL